MHLNPGGCARRVVGEDRSGVEDRSRLTGPHSTTETLSVASPSAVRDYGRLSGTKNDASNVACRVPRGTCGERFSARPDTTGLPSNHAVPTYSVRRASPPDTKRTNVSIRGCGSTSIMVTGLLSRDFGVICRAQRY